MEREIDMKEVSDGRLYTSNDLVKADCGGCEGCSSCCTGMGSSITLDPLDVFRLCAATGKDFESMLDRQIELNIVDGVILPNLKMAGDGERCPFLNPEGRCSIHEYRPGICRLFPLGRIYEDGDFRYFLQVHECPKKKTKVRVRKWLDTPDLKRYEQFVRDWHYYLKDLQKETEKAPDQIRELSMSVLRLFCMLPYDRNRDFYDQFYERFRR